MRYACNANTLPTHRFEGFVKRRHAPVRKRDPKISEPNAEPIARGLRRTRRIGGDYARSHVAAYRVDAIAPGETGESEVRAINAGGDIAVAFTKIAVERSFNLGDSFKSIATAISRNGMAAGHDGEYTRCSISGLELASAVTYVRGRYISSIARATGSAASRSTGSTIAGRSSARAGNSCDTPTVARSRSKRSRRVRKITARALRRSIPKAALSAHDGYRRCVQRRLMRVRYQRGGHGRRVRGKRCGALDR